MGGNLTHVVGEEGLPDPELFEVNTVGFHGDPPFWVGAFTLKDAPEHTPVLIDYTGAVRLLHWAEAQARKDGSDGSGVRYWAYDLGRHAFMVTEDCGAGLEATVIYPEIKIRINGWDQRLYRVLSHWMWTRKP